VLSDVYLPCSAKLFRNLLSGDTSLVFPTGSGAAVAAPEVSSVLWTEFIAEQNMVCFCLHQLLKLIQTNFNRVVLCNTFDKFWVDLLDFCKAFVINPGDLDKSGVREAVLLTGVLLRAFIELLVKAKPFVGKEDILEQTQAMAISVLSIDCSRE
jgi:hypothetical protein